jgi:hypothetical protein
MALAFMAFVLGPEEYAFFDSEDMKARVVAPGATARSEPRRARCGHAPLSQKLVETPPVVLVTHFVPGKDAQSALVVHDDAQYLSVGFGTQTSFLPSWFAPPTPSPMQSASAAQPKVEQAPALAMHSRPVLQVVEALHGSPTPGPCSMELAVALVHAEVDWNWQRPATHAAGCSQNGPVGPHARKSPARGWQTPPVAPIVHLPLSAQSTMPPSVATPQVVLLVRVAAHLPTFVLHARGNAQSAPLAQGPPTTLWSVQVPFTHDEWTEQACVDEQAWPSATWAPQVPPSPHNRPVWQSAVPPHGSPALCRAVQTAQVPAAVVGHTPFAHCSLHRQGAPKGSVPLARQVVT